MDAASQHRHRRHSRDHRAGALCAGRAPATRSISSTKCTCCRSRAFNALLKTLEEPPPHVKFIFATTEIRKVPVTILSRCQRFDLRRLEAERLVEHLGMVGGKRRHRGGTGGAAADRPGGGRVGARWFVAARPGHLLRRRRRQRPRSQRNARPDRSRAGGGSLRGRDAGRHGGGDSSSWRTSMRMARTPRRC